MLDNRKPGELPELNNKMVKVRQPEDTDTPTLILTFERQTQLHTDACVCVCVFLQSTVRVVFHDRRLQYTEHQQLEGWKWNRPGDRLLDIGNAAWHKSSHEFYFFFFLQLDIVFALITFTIHRFI